MATAGESRFWQGGANPFPSAAVARVFDSGPGVLTIAPGVLTIKTGSVREADRFVDGYLSAAQAADAEDRPGDRLTGTGKVCVIAGEYGAGKTHLAIEILSRAEAARGGIRTDLRVLYRAAPGGSFHTLYASLMKDSFGLTEVLARVREFYADIVADALRERPYTEELAARLKRGDEIDPQLVVDRYGLKEGALRDQLRQRLSAVTRDETFSRALMLLLQPELRPLAWDWFAGGSPGEVLAERGVTKPIQTDIEALEALGVIVRLYGRRNRRFVLVVDELEKVSMAWDASDTARTQAFKALLEVFHGAGALLVLCGLPDIFDMLPRASGRVDAVIHPSPFTAADVRSYIEQAQGRAFGRSVLEPFSGESVQRIVSLTGGAARDVLRICYQAYAQAAETGEMITPSAIDLVARYRMPDGGADRVRADIADLLRRQGWRAERHQVLGDPDVTADFWIPVDEPGAGCAILVSDSVLEDPPARRLAEQLAAIRAAGAARALILVVAGYLPAEQRRVLEAALGEDPLIVYSAGSFSREFPDAVNAVIDRIGAAASRAHHAESGEDEIRLLRAETERLGRKQDVALSLMREMLDLASQDMDRVTGLEQAMTAASGRSPARPGGQPGLPSALEALFSGARRALDSYGDIRQFVGTTFDITTLQPGQRFPLTHRLREPDAFTAVGVAAFLSGILDAFSESVRAWLGAAGSGPGQNDGPTAEHRERLSRICQTYDALYGVTQVFRLDSLPELTTVAWSGREPLGSPSRAARREALQRSFGGLGDRVYKAAMDAAGSMSGRGDDVPG